MALRSAGTATDPMSSDGCVHRAVALRYLVILPPGTPQRIARTRIAAACGALASYYAPIAVAVATSGDPSFAAYLGPRQAYSAQAEALDDRGRPVKQDETQSSGPGPDQRPATTSVTAGAALRGAPTADLRGQQWDMRMIGAPAARRIEQGSSSVLVGVLDSGIDPAQPDLAHAMDAADSAGCVSGVPVRTPGAWEPSTSSHGTHVAGIIAAADDGLGITGVAPGVRVASVKVVDDSGYIYPAAAVCGLMWAAARHMTLTNNSYFVDPWLFTCPGTSGQNVIFTALRRAVRYARQRGVLSVAAAGNQEVDESAPTTDAGSPDNAPSRDRSSRALYPGCAVLPAGLPGVVTVSAVDSAGLKAGYSGYGLGSITVTAPGGSQGGAGQGCVLSTVPGG
ncbi:MAG: S8 family peptidase, partial [Sciscionella sp.]